MKGCMSDIDFYFIQENFLSGRRMGEYNPRFVITSVNEFMN